MSGYTPCACRDCFDVSISNDLNIPELCLDCDAAGCDGDGCSECQRDDAYGAGDYARELDFDTDEV